MSFHDTSADRVLLRKYARWFTSYENFPVRALRWEREFLS